jgi:hypothetical protein
MTKRALVWNAPDHIPNDYEKASFSKPALAGRREVFFFVSSALFYPDGFHRDRYQRFKSAAI